MGNAVLHRGETNVESCGYFVHYSQNCHSGLIMKSMSAKDAKNGFGHLLDTARAEPVTIEKHGRAVVVVIAIEEYRRLIALDEGHAQTDLFEGNEDAIDRAK